MKHSWRFSTYVSMKSEEFFSFTLSKIKKKIEDVPFKSIYILEQVVRLRKKAKTLTTTALWKVYVIKSAETNEGYVQTKQIWTKSIDFCFLEASTRETASLLPKIEIYCSKPKNSTT